MHALIKSLIDLVVLFTNQFLVPFLLSAFVFGVIARILVFYTVKRQEWFVKEFEKRVIKHVEKEVGNARKSESFYILSKRLLEKTYYELFEVRAANKRRRTDYITTPSDRLFLIQTGSAWFVREALRHFRFLRKSDEDPKFLDISKNIFKSVAPWNKVFGIVPVGPLNDLLNLMSGLFIIGGIFGTFNGIMEALPSLGGMDMADIEKSQKTMSIFLAHVSFSMSTSIIGIMCSVLLAIVNALCNPEKAFFMTVTKLDATLAFLWGRCETNVVPDGTPQFDEHKDPIDALAELAVDKELKNYSPGEDSDRPRLPISTPKRVESEEAKKTAS